MTFTVLNGRAKPQARLRSVTHVLNAWNVTSLRQSSIELFVC